MWWQQSLWKLPPTYTDHPDGSGGLRYWVDRMVDGAAFQIQSDFVQYVVQPHFLLVRADRLRHRGVHRRLADDRDGGSPLRR